VVKLILTDEMKALQMRGFFMRGTGYGTKSHLFHFTYFYNMEFAEIKKAVIPVLKKHKITKAGIFGSYAKNMATDKSDVDILVELTYPMSLLDFIGIKQELEDILKKSVDLVEYKAIKPIIRDNILKSEIRIYG
jgi:uncharacterized protein